MNTAEPQFLVESDWLEARLDDPELRILDCMVFVHAAGLESGREKWTEGHIPGSGFADLVTELSNPDRPIPLMMPSEEQFAAAMSRYGVGEGTRVVLYDAGRNMWAARLWWMLRAFSFDNAVVLNGGWRKWTLEGRPVSTEPPTHPQGDFIARPRPELIAGKEEVLAAIEDDDSCLIDALRQTEYSGKVAFYGRPGHIPTSVNVAARSLVDRDSQAYSPEARLREIFADAGALSGGRVIAYCGAGIAASSVALILTMLGVENVAVYDGSLLEWAPDPSLPMTT
jgi:thiosulfate/3-mercaptopyruvate sulfurtransferase